MKKTAIYIYASLVIAVLLIFGFVRLSSFHSISFKTEHTGLTTELYRQVNERKSEKIGTVENGSKLTLEAGNYYYLATGEHVAPKVGKFEVTRSEEIAIQTNFTGDYLVSLLGPEEPTIHAAISRYNPKVDTYFTINKGTLYGRGDWYGTTLTSKKDDPVQPNDNYRVVLNKQNGQWRVIGKPELILSAPDYPNVPKEFLSRINQLDPSRIVRSEADADLD